jgi:thymidylate synthase
MQVIKAHNVNDAFWLGLRLLQNGGERQSSRAGNVVVHPEPVTTQYLFPQQRVLLAAYRDANPVFHLMEALWMLAGRNDATFLDQFVADFSARFAEADGHMHGAYGFRWRQHFDLDGGGEAPLDQLEEVVRLLRANPNDRRVVLTMWDPLADLGTDHKDVPCNTHVYFRIRQEVEVVGASYAYGMGGAHQERISYLDMTVCCRSNDMWWGAYGANAVHFSVLQEYLARRIGVEIGTYHQISNNFHIYTDVTEKLGEPEAYEIDPYASWLKSTPIVTAPEVFDDELAAFFRGDTFFEYKNTFLREIAWPLWAAYKLWRTKDRLLALHMVKELPGNCDWRVATERWFIRRMSKVKQEA